jgi:hypothetical protein
MRQMGFKGVYVYAAECLNSKAWTLHPNPKPTPTLNQIPQNALPLNLKLQTLNPRPQAPKP